jgi:hypothetical protein
MSLDELRTLWKQRLEAIAPTIGVVTDFEPYVDREEDFKTFFLSETLGYAQGWTITREASAERGYDDTKNYRAHSFVFRGYSALNTAGASEKAFQDLVETVTATLRREMRDQLGGKAMVAPPAVRVVDVRKFTTILVHYAELTITCTELVGIAP